MECWCTLLYSTLRNKSAYIHMYHARALSRWDTYCALVLCTSYICRTISLENRSECRTTYLRYQYNLFHYFVMQLEALCIRSASKGPGYGWARWGHINLNYPITSYDVAILMFPLPPPGRYVLDRLHRLLTYQL